MNASTTIPRFSVIIPAYNSARTLPRALQSVIGQQRVEAEIIVVDDASSDDTPVLMKDFGARVRYLRRDRNQGVASARNFGAREATGEWLAFLDADDYYYPERLWAHASWIAQDGTLDLLTGDYDYVDAEGGFLGSSMAPRAYGNRLLEQADGAGRSVMELPFFEDFIADHFGDTHTLSVPRATFLRVGGYPEGFAICEDVHLLTRLVAVSRRIGVVCRRLGAYVVHGASATRRDPVRAQRENVRTLLDLAARSHAFPPEIRRGVARRMRGARLNLAYALVRGGARGAALGAVAPLLMQRPGLQSVRDFLSILKG